MANPHGTSPGGDGALAASAPRFPRWLSAAWWLALPGAALLTLRLLYEATWLTWMHGPQMVGFSLMHTAGWFVAWGLLSLAVLAVWSLGTGGWLVVRRLSSAPMPRGALLRLAVALILCAAFLLIPANSGQ